MVRVAVQAGAAPVAAAAHTRQVARRSRARTRSPVELGTSAPIDPGGRPPPNGDLTIFTLALSGAIDPTTLMQAIAVQMRRLQTDNQTTAVRNSGEAARAADRRAEALLEKAEKMARKAAEKAPPWVKKLIGAVLTAIGSLLSIFGGAGAALVAVAVVLIAAGDIIDGMAERGMIPEKAGRIVGLCCKLLGALLMAGAGIASTAGNASATASTAENLGSSATTAGGTAGQAVQETTQAAGNVAQGAEVAAKVESTTKALKLIKSLLEPLQQLVEVGVDTAHAAFQFQADMAQQNASEQRVRSEQDRDFAETAVEAIKDVFAQHAGMVRRLESARQAQSEASLAAARGIV